MVLVPAATLIWLFGNGTWVPGLTTAMICLVLVPFAPIGVPILCAAAAALLGLRRP